MIAEVTVALIVEIQDGNRRPPDIYAYRVLTGADFRSLFARQKSHIYEQYQSFVCRVCCGC